MANEFNQIRVPMNGGFLIAERNGDTTDYDGITIMFETADGDLIDVVTAECKSQFNRTKIDVYTYEDAYDEDVLYDEISSGLLVNEIRRKRQELFQSLELYYRVFILKENIDGLLEE